MKTFNEKTGETKLNGLFFLYEGQTYIDWQGLIALVDIPPSTLHKMIKEMEVPKIKYANRHYYLYSWCTEFWKHVSEASLSKKSKAVGGTH